MTVSKPSLRRTETYRQTDRHTDRTDKQTDRRTHSLDGEQDREHSELSIDFVFGFDRSLVSFCHQTTIQSWQNRIFSRAAEKNLAVVSHCIDGIWMEVLR